MADGILAGMGGMNAVPCPDWAIGQSWGNCPAESSPCDFRQQVCETCAGPGRAWHLRHVSRGFARFLLLDPGQLQIEP